MRKTCLHIVGYDDYTNGERIFGELVFYQEEAEVEFNFCPLCGCDLRAAPMSPRA